MRELIPCKGLIPKVTTQVIFRHGIQFFSQLVPRTWRGCSWVGWKCDSSFNFRKFPVTKLQQFSRISGKEENLSRYTKIFGNCLPRISVPFDILPGIFGQVVHLSKIRQFPNFLETYLLPLWMESALDRLEDLTIIRESYFGTINSLSGRRLFWLSPI